MAKNVYVWLDQLSKKYRRPIQRLTRSPMKSWTPGTMGFYGPLADRPMGAESGVEKRSSSAGESGGSCLGLLSLRLQIAADLGGEEPSRISRTGRGSEASVLRAIWCPTMSVFIPDGSSSIPTGLSPWITAPSLVSFHGRTFPDRRDVGIEDHYYDRTDAAVVFKRVDRRQATRNTSITAMTGPVCPGTTRPSSITLMPEVREAVIQTILHVARKFPIIRFDAAMTLTKRHYQRLWFPEPGTGGAIPSRSELWYDQGAV